MGCVYTNIGVLLLFSPKDDGSGRKNYLSLDNCFFCFENQLALTITSNDVRLNSAPPPQSLPSKFVLQYFIAYPRLTNIMNFKIKR